MSYKGSRRARGSTCGTPNIAEVRAASHAQLKRKYEHAAFYPWMPPEPDPPLNVQETRSIGEDAPREIPRQCSRRASMTIRPEPQVRGRYHGSRRSVFR